MWKKIKYIRAKKKSQYIRGILVRQKKPNCLIASKPTGTFQMYYLVWTCSISFSNINLVLQVPL